MKGKIITTTRKSGDRGYVIADFLKGIAHIFVSSEKTTKQNQPNMLLHKLQEQKRRGLLKSTPDGRVTAMILESLDKIEEKIVRNMRNGF